MADMGHYSHVHNVSGSTSRPPGRLRLVDVSMLAMRAEVATIAFWRAVIAECLASLLLVLFGCLATLTCPGPRDPNAHTLLVALCFGLTMASLVQCFQHISGAHLNPVVSLVQLVTCKVTPLRALLYALAQTGGAVAGASILHGITTGSCQSELGVTVLHYGLSPWQGLGIEILLTFLFIFTVCATLDPNRTEVTNKALLIGLAVAGCHLAGYRFTGCSMNPARSLGPAFVASNWKHHWDGVSAHGQTIRATPHRWALRRRMIPDRCLKAYAKSLCAGEVLKYLRIYWAGPTLGGVAAGLLYEFIFDPSRTRSRSQVPASLDAEDGLATTSLTTVNPAHFTPTTSTPRHYYNSSPTISNHCNNLLGSPRSSRRDPNPNLTPHTTSLNNTATTSTTTPNHYVPGTYGERALIDIREGQTHNDVIAPPVPRRNDLTSSGSRRGLPGESMTYFRRHVDDVTPGRENEAYSFDSHPRRLQPPCSGSSHPQPNVLNLFDDGRETICLNDVRVF